MGWRDYAVEETATTAPATADWRSYAIPYEEPAPLAPTNVEPPRDATFMEQVGAGALGAAASFPGAQTLGGMLAAPISSAITGKPVSADVGRDTVEEYKTLAPEGFYTGNILGSLGLGAATAVPLGAVSKAGTALANQIPSALVRRATKVLGTIGGGALTADVFSRIYGADEAKMQDKVAALTAPVGEAAAIGAALPVAGFALKGAGQALDQYVKPPLIDTAKDIIEKAKRYGISIGLDDLTSSEAYKRLVDTAQKLPFIGNANDPLKQKQEWTRAVSKTIGLDTDTLTFDQFAKAKDAMRSTFDSISDGKTFSVGQSNVTKLADIYKEVGDATYGLPSDIEPIAKKYIDDVLGTIKNGTIDGKSWKALRNKFSKISRKSSDAGVKELASDIEDFIIDMLDPKSAKELADVKLQYKNAKILEPLVEKASRDGVLDPKLLQSRVAQKYGTAYAEGKAGPIGDLAQLGQVIKQTIPDSGTTFSQFATKLLTNPLAQATGGATALAMGGLPAAAGLAGTVGLNTLIQQRNMNPEVIGRLLAQQGAPPSVVRQTLGNLIQPSGAGVFTGSMLPSQPPEEYQQ